MSLTEICANTNIPEASLWTIKEVGEWIENIGYPQYRNCFVENYIDGKKLISVNASTLPMMGITKFDHTQIIAKRIRELLSLEEPNNKRTIRLPPRDFLGMYLESKTNTGSDLAKVSFPRLVFRTMDRIWQPPLGNEGIIFEYSHKKSFLE
ncbi:hypothetical protein EG68_02437 [Paragonimus skrjabini miyazakii]|uniref:SAM domain-containing protein n=1 Tax=Paragonimus skrjabini miyazakii TaxID=59628 RepID=A0A8S9ZAL5_9TREM|nr:hypothetical protein EG68_02437 [Paragonimus skrjabini miyazakii]